MKRVVCALSIVALILAAGNCPHTDAAIGQTKPAVGGITKVQSDPASGISEYKLNSNGLQILLAERHHTPIVTVMVVYHVGSRNEAVGYTGSTHFLEHMMFRGTKEHDPLKGTGIDDILKPLGGLNNATTYFDRTNYYEIVPSQYMGVCLELEADRMRGALLRQADQKSEMTVVRNELERDEDDPTRLMEVNTFAEAYMAHPYHHPVIGWRSDVENVPITRLHKFYNDFYYPNNATLVVIGDFKTPEALSLIEKYFAKVPHSPAPFPSVYTAEPPQQGERRFTIRRGEDLPKVMLGFHIPEATSKDTYALEVLASLLGDDKKQSSRLYKALVDTNLATDCYAYNYSLHDPGMFTMLATANGDTPSEKLEATLLSEAQNLAKQPVSDEELDKAKKSVWKRMKLDAADPTGLSSQLAEAIAVADWHWWVNLENNIKSVTKADIQRVAEKYFQKNNETVGYYYPLHKPAPGQQPASESTPPGTQGLMNVPADYAPPPIVAAQATSPVVANTSSTARASIAPQVRKKVLPNGLTVLTMPVPGSGVVAIAGKIRAGDYFRAPDQEEIPNFVADMLDKGSEHFTKDQIAQQLELMGSSLDFSAGSFFTTFESDIVREDVPTYLGMLADVIQRPRFSPEELEKSKKQTLSEIQASMSDTSAVATNAFYNAVYAPSCVYHRKPFAEQMKDVGTVNAAQLKEFHGKHITPANTVIAVVGDIEPEQAFALVEKNFSDWKGGPAEAVNVSDCATGLIAGKRLDNPLKDKTNVEVIMGEPSPLSITAPDFYAASIANAALGHDTLSSRLAELRNKHGLTYGISSFFSENAFPNGAWMIDFTVNPENINKAIPIVTDIVRKYRKSGLTADEVKNEASRLSGEYIVERMRTPHQLADAITKYEILGLGAKFMDEFPVKLKKVTVEQANKAVDKYFNPDKLVTAVAGTLSAKK